MVVVFLNSCSMYLNNRSFFFSFFMFGLFIYFSSFDIALKFHYGHSFNPIQSRINCLKACIKKYTVHLTLDVCFFFFLKEPLMCVLILTLT